MKRYPYILLAATAAAVVATAQEPPRPAVITNAPPPVVGARPVADYPAGEAKNWADVPFTTVVHPDLIEAGPDIANKAQEFSEWKAGGSLSAGGGASTGAAGNATAIGQGATVTANDGTAVGSYTTAGNFGTAVGNYLTGATGPYSAAFGSWAKADAFQAIQLGPGENKTQNSLQVLQWPLLIEGYIPFDRLPYRDLQALAEQTVSEWTNAVIVVQGENLRVDVETDAGRTSVWSSASMKAAEIAELKAQAQSLLARIQALEEGGGASSWNEWAADGSANPDPAYMTFLNRPATMFGSGYAWETAGAFSVLTQSGSVAFANSPGEGEFRIGASSTNYFGFKMGGSVVVGARCNSFRIEGAGAEALAVMEYDYFGGDFPTLWFTPKLGVDFAEIENVSKVDNGDGSCTITAPASTPGGFFYATSSKKLDSIFVSTMPAHLQGGVFGSTNSLPVVYDSTIEIQNGGRTYIIPAQEKR